MCLSKCKNFILFCVLFEKCLIFSVLRFDKKSKLKLFDKFILTTRKGPFGSLSFSIPRRKKLKFQMIISLNW